MKKVNQFLGNLGEHMTLGNVVKVTFLAVGIIAAYKKAKQLWLQKQGQQMVQQHQTQPQGPVIVGPSPNLHRSYPQAQQNNMQQNNPMQAPVPQMPVPQQATAQTGPQLVGPVTQFANGDNNSQAIEQQMKAQADMSDYLPTVPNMDEIPSGMDEGGQFYV